MKEFSYLKTMGNGTPIFYTIVYNSYIIHT